MLGRESINKLRQRECLAFTLLVFTLFLLPNIFATNLQMEWGNTTISPQTWTNITLENSYVSPIIIVSPQYTTTTEDRGIGVWLDNVSENSFQVYAANYLFDSTDSIKVNYIVVEEGNWTFPNTSSIIEAGKFSTNRVGLAGTGNWECPVHGNKVYFTTNFSSNPLVLSTRATNNNNAWGITFQNNLDDELLSPDINGACIGLSQANAPTVNPITNYETIYWLALDEFHTTINGVEIESLWNLADTGTSAGNWINGYADSSPFAQNFQSSFSTTPIGAVVSQSSNNGGEGGWGVLYSLTTTAINMFIDENIDRSHTKSESGGGFAFTAPLSYGNEAPDSLNISIDPNFTWQNNNVLISVNVTDPQSVFTIKNVTGTILYPNTTSKNFSFNNSAPQTKSLQTTDQEPAQTNVTVPPDESIWLDGWNYRKNFNITGSNVSDVDNYTLKLYIYNKEGSDYENHVYLNGKAKSDYSDIRFTNSLANTSGILPYWKEREGADYAVFWIKFDNINMTPNNTSFYLYYNNSLATSTGNGNETFLYFEDFENYTSTADSVIPPTWQNYNLGTVLLDTETNGNRVLKKTANNDPNGGKTSLGVNFSNYELLWKTNRINSLNGKINRYAISDELANGYSTYSSNFGPSMTYKLEKRTLGAASALPGGTKTFATEYNVWYYMKLNRYEGNFNFVFMDLTETVFETFQTYDTSWTNFNTLYIHGGQEYWSDDFLLRKYVDAEPYFSSWGEEKKWKNAIDGNTTYKTYSFVDSSKIQNLLSITITMNITQNSFGASDENSNTYPSLEISFSNSENADWQIIGSIYPTSPGEYNLTTTNTNILENWRFEDNRNVRIRGINLDNFNTSLYDLIEWNSLILEIEYQESSNEWFLNFNDTGDAGIYNVTNIIVCDKGHLCNDKSYDNATFEITDKGNITLYSPYDNEKFIGINQSIDFNWTIKSSFVNNDCMFYIDNIWIRNVSCPTDVNVSTQYNFSQKGIHTWKVESKDEFNKTAFSDIYTFYIIPNISIRMDKQIKNTGPDVYLVKTTTTLYTAESNTTLYFDTVPTSYSGGSYSRIYDLFQLISSGTRKLYYWKINQSEEINYSYTSTNPNYKLSNIFVGGLG